MRLINNSFYKRFLLYSRYFLIASLCGFGLLITAAFIPRKLSNHLKDDCNVQICVSNTGIHSNIIVPTINKAYDWSNYLPLADVGMDTAKDYKYLSFGWGDRAFYMSTPSLAELQLSTTFNALFLPTSSTMYVKGYQSIPNNLEVKCIKINQDDYLQLVKHIQGTFEVDTQGKIIRIGNGHTDNAGFYAAIGNYSILRNCNSWTAEGLRKADVNTPLWDGLSAAIMWHLRSAGC
jgi:uncharacterized protein (TIGR02117 family)